VQRGLRTRLRVTVVGVRAGGDQERHDPWVVLILISVVLVVTSIVADVSAPHDAAWWAPAVIPIVPAVGLLA
jgi:hypothetical protein